MNTLVPLKPFTAWSNATAQRLRSGGSTMIITMGLVTVLMVMIGLAFTLTQNNGRNADRSANLAVAQMVAEGCLEYEFAQWRNLCQNGSQFAPPTSYFANLSLPTTSMFPSLSATSTFATGSANNSYTISNYQISAADAYLNPISGQPTALSQDGKKNQIWQYIASANVTVPCVSGPQTVALSRIFQLVNRSPWTYAIFYDGNLEINPGAAMTVTGDVFTNSTLYTNLGGGALTFVGTVEAAKGTVLSSTNGAVVFPPGYPMKGVATQSPMGISGIQLSASDTNPNNDSYHELIQQPVTTGSNIADPFTSSTSDPLHPPQRFYNSADLKINISNNVTDSQTPVVSILDPNNVVVSTSIANALTQGTGTISRVLTLGNHTTSFKPPGSATSVSIVTTLQDTRENAKVRLIDFDVGALKSLIDKSIITTGTTSTATLDNMYNKGGIVVYIQETDPQLSGTQTTSSGTLSAIRLVNGSALPTGGLTVVSNNPIYVLGDFNTGVLPGTSGTVPWQPSSIIGDAVTILSNNWVTSDSNYSNSNSLSTRVASATTVNAAIMSGNVPTASAGLGQNTQATGYSGGVENFTRFLENWSGVTFTYTGSMVALYSSQSAKNAWPGTGTVYNPPTRVWNYDTRFINQPPPGSFTVTTYNKQRWLKR